MSSYFKIYWFLIIIKPLFGIFLILQYLTPYNLVYLFKIPITLSFIVIVLYFIDNKLNYNKITFLMLCAFVISSLMMLFFVNKFSNVFITHLYMIFVVVFSTSFGWAFAKNYNKESHLYVRKSMNYFFIFTIIIMFIYFYHYYVTNRIEYFGFDSELPIISSYFLGLEKYGFFVLALFLVLLSGKRAPLISMIFLLIVYVYKKTNFLKISSLFKLLLLSVIFSYIFYLANENGFFRRFEFIYQLDLTDRDLLYIGTSGRIAEYEAIFDHLNEKPIRWVFGSGLGAEYLISWTYGDSVERYQHYSHLSVLSYIFIFGLPFTLLLFYYLIKISFNNLKYFKLNFYLIFLSLFISSLFGAGMLVDTFFWFILGINLYIYKSDNQKLKIIKLNS